MENRARRRAAEGNRKPLYMKPPISGRVYIVTQKTPLYLG
jgi:hypothetical protein